MWLAPFVPLMSMMVSSSSERSSCIRTDRKGERKVPRLFRALSPLSPILGLLSCSPLATLNADILLPSCSTELQVKGVRTSPVLHLAVFYILGMTALHDLKGVLSIPKEPCTP